MISSFAMFPPHNSGPIDEQCDHRERGQQVGLRNPCTGRQSRLNSVLGPAIRAWLDHRAWESHLARAMEDDERLQVPFCRWRAPLSGPALHACEESG